MRRVLALDGAAPGWRLRAIVGSAYLAFLEDDFDAVAVACSEGIGLSDRVGDRRSKAMLLSTQAEVLRMQEDGAEGAEDLCTEAVRLFEEVGDRWGEVEVIDTEITLHDPED